MKNLQNCFNYSKNCKNMYKDRIFEQKLKKKLAAMPFRFVIINIFFYLNIIE